MRDYQRLTQEIRILERRFGRNKVFWDSLDRWVMVEDFPLPPGLNRRRTNVIVVIPENYGNGDFLRDLFVDPDLQAYNRSTGRYECIPHYHVLYPYEAKALSLGLPEDWQKKGWQYLCLHLYGGSLQTYLNTLYKFLNEPFRDWQALFDSYHAVRR